MSVISILLFLAICGTEPDLKLPDGEQPRGREFLGQTLLSASVPTGTSARQTSQDDHSAASRNPLRDRLTVRSQSFETEPPEFVLASPEPRGFHRHLAYELADTLNPFNRTTVRVLPGYYDPYGWQGHYGTDGYQPWRLGWTLHHDLAILPLSTVSGGTTGELQIVEWNSNLRLSEIVAPGVVFNGTGHFNARYWDGPGGVALPGQVDQFSADLELGFFNDGPWSAQIGFHPQIVNGYGAKLNHNSINIDGRAIVSYLASPNWSLVGGVAFWDRVNLLVVPHVGVIWTPDTRWELRLLYPKTRISYFLGRRGQSDFWLYGCAEHTAEAWQANIGSPTVVADRIQLTDDRVSIGLRWDSGRHSAFVEAGCAFNRRAIFAGPTPDFDISNVGMLRAGLRF